MKAKEYLQQIEKIDGLIEFKKERIELYKSMAMKMTSGTETVKIGTETHAVEKVQSSGSLDPMGDAISDKMDMEKVLLAEIMELTAEKERIIKTMETLPPLEFKLLYRIYVGKVVESKIKGERVKSIVYLTLDEAAAELGRSRRWATSSHGSGLAKVQKILDERKKDGTEDMDRRKSS